MPPHPLHRIREAAVWLRLVGLAIAHGVILYGLFERNTSALSTAVYLENWLIAEIVAVILTPYLMLLTVRDHETALWERLLWLPFTVIVLGGIGGAFRLFKATWVYVLTCMPVLWGSRTTDEANRGCARSMMNLVLLVILMGVFANRPTSWPIGTLAGRWMEPDVRNAANSMALATFYFAIGAGLEFAIARWQRKHGTRLGRSAAHG